jgi:IMP cyclohydrolase
MTDDFSVLEHMVYSGRGIIIGTTPLEQPFVAYSLTGRSPSSQARRLLYNPETHVVRTDVTDPEQLAKGNPKLLIYPAVMGYKHGIVASNGTQTALLHDAAQLSQTSPDQIIRKAFAQPHSVEGIDVTTFEPDNPNFTPRISACVTEKQGSLHIVKKGADGQPIISTHLFDLHKGKGLGITTYKGGNENPLLPFDGDLLEVQVSSCRPADIAQNLYAALRGKSPDDYRVAVAVMLYLPSNKQFVVHTVNRHGDGQ